MNKKLKILLLEDYPSDAQLVVRALKKGNLDFESIVVDTKEGYNKALIEFSPDIVLSDHLLPSFNSYDAFALLKKSGLKIPFIIVTGPVSEEFAVDVINKGADDYILKDRLERLPSAINNALEKYRLEKDGQVYLDELIKTEKRFRALVENGADAVVIMNTAGSPTYVSASIQGILGYTEEEAIKLNMFEEMHPDERAGAASKMAECIEKPGVPVYGAPARVRHKNGSGIWLEATITNMLHDPDINGIVDNFRDVTERKLSEEKLIHANRLYSFISQINQTIVHVEDEQTLFDEACRIAIDQGKFKMAWIGVVDAINEKINLVASHMVSAADIEMFTNYTYSPGGAIDKVLMGPDIYVVLDIFKDLGPKLKKYLTERGFCSGISLAIKKSGTVTAVFSIYSSEPDFFNSAEIDLLKEATEDISFALDVFEKDKKRLLAEQKLKDSQARLKQAKAIGHLGSWELDFTTGVACWSEEALHIYGLHPDDDTQPNKSWLKFVHPEDIEHVLKVTNEAESVFSGVAFFHRIIRRDGTIRHIYSQLHFQFNDEGIATGMYCVVHDITDMKETEEALRKSESNLQAIFDNTSEGFILVDKTGVLKSFNNKAKEFVLLNTGEELKTGISIFDFLAKDRRENYENIILRAVAGETIQYEFFYERKPGKKSWFNLSINSVYNDAGIEAICITATDITERKQIEDSLKQSEQGYRQIVETAQEGIWVTDKNNTTTFVNKKMCDILGYSSKQMLGKDIFYFMDKKGKQKTAQLMEDKKQGKLRNGEFKYISKTGKAIWANIYSNPIFDDEGTYTGALAMVSDITEKKTLKDLLDKANQLARIGNWEIDLINNTLFWSAITRQIHEVSADFVPAIETGINFYKAGTSRDSITVAVGEAIQKNIPFDLELQLVTAKGNELWIRAIGEGEFADGKCVKVFGSFQDIDKRKKGEAELLNAYEEKDSILESIGDGFYALDKNWIITYWNKQAETLLGKKREEVVGRNIWEVYPDTIGTITFTNYHNAVENNTVQHYERFNKTLNHWAEISAYPSPNGLSVYFKDVTERKLKEIEHAQIVADMIQRNNDLEQFSYIISHNLRAPVANIIGLAKELSEDGEDPETLKMLNKYLGISVEQLDNVITDLNSILEVKKEVNSRRELVVLSKLVDEIKSSIQHLIKKENVQIKTDFSAAVGFITLKSYLYSIFYNLILNSIKYSQPDIPASIEINGVKSGGKLIITFKDNGTGIDLAKKGDQVFGLYKRFHQNIEGKGIGLFMVKTQVETLGGKITINSEVNKGTEFRIEL